MSQANSEIREKIKIKKEIFQSFRRADVMNQIRAKMVEKNIKNKDIAERLGVSEANVSRWLRGNQNVGIDTIYQLADAIDTELNIVVGEISASGDKSDGYQVAPDISSDIIFFETRKTFERYSAAGYKGGHELSFTSSNNAGCNDDYLCDVLAV